jgi:hypothetical protein
VPTLQEVFIKQHSVNDAHQNAVKAQTRDLTRMQIVYDVLSKALLNFTNWFAGSVKFYLKPG